MTGKQMSLLEVAHQKSSKTPVMPRFQVYDGNNHIQEYTDLLEQPCKNETIVRNEAVIVKPWFKSESKPALVYKIVKPETEPRLDLAFIRKVLEI